MKIALVGPGIMEIPPSRWGAVEMVIWDVYNIAKAAGHPIDIINTPDQSQIVDCVNGGNYDVVHVHYDVFSHLMSNLKAKVKILSSHYPFINEPSRYYLDGYDRLVPFIVNNTDYCIFASSPKDIDTFVSFGANRKNMFLSRLGVKINEYNFIDTPSYSKTLCFSQIVDRKRQAHIQSIPDIDFVGRLDDPNFDTRSNYLGEYNRKKLNEEITKYANFVLLSKVENTTPLAVKEALVCGLGVVVSESVSQELDISKKFITVIPENKMNDLQYIREKIDYNRWVSFTERKNIREYGIKNFDFNNIVMNEYLPKLFSLINSNK
jgi:hypothetical protein